MHAPSRTLSLILLPLLTLILGWQVGVRFEQRALENAYERLELLYTGKSGSGDLLTDPQEEVDLTLLWGVWRLLIRHYIEPDELAVTPMLYGAVRGLVASLGDPYTSFMEPQETEDFHVALNGELQGIGAQLSVRDGRTVVVTPLKESPAEHAGLQAEDVIFEVNGESMKGKTLSEVVHRIRGPKGTEVTLGVAREGEFDLLDITIVRDNIKVPTVEGRTEETSTGSVAILTLNQFGEDSLQDLSEELLELLKKNPDGLVLDLRFNGGGYLEGAVELTSLFLPKGKVVSVERRSTPPQHFYVSGRPLAEEMPLVVLINEASASASEIVAGALQDHGRATIVGKKSFGKGTVQEVIDLPGGSSLRVTTARWLTPEGRDLGKEGVEPDVVVERAEKDEEGDPQLDAALRSVFKQGRTEAP